MIKLRRANPTKPVNPPDARARLNLLVPREIKTFRKDYAERRFTSVTQVIVDQIIRLKEQESRPDVPQI